MSHRSEPDTRRERLAHPWLNRETLFVASWWAASIAFGGVTWLFVITLLF